MPLKHQSTNEPHTKHFVGFSVPIVIGIVFLWQKI